MLRAAVSRGRSVLGARAWAQGGLLQQQQAGRGYSSDTLTLQEEARAFQNEDDITILQKASDDETARGRLFSKVNYLELDISYPAYMIWGANTDVGKTLVSAGLSASILSERFPSLSAKDTGSDVLYVKPVQTGYPNDSDARFVTTQVAKSLKSRQQENRNKVYIRNQFLNVSPAVRRSVNFEAAFSSSEAGVGMKHVGICDEEILEGTDLSDQGGDGTLGKDARNAAADDVFSSSHLTCTTMWSWFDPVSPHLAAEKEGVTVDDCSVLGALTASLQSFVKTKCDGQGKALLQKWAIIETAGGVASPGPSGTLQCDVYRPLRMPAVLVGDGRLGGVSTTISAFDSLWVRGYDVAAVIVLDTGLRNDQPIMRYLQGRVPVFVLPPVPTDPSEDLANWFAQCKGLFSQLQFTLEGVQRNRIERLQEMPGKAMEILWWPFTQHSLASKTEITVIDSRCGETFSIHKNALDRPEGALVQQYDGCASWWTQGPDANFQPVLARDLGYAAARYGHIMFPENVYEPALQCAELLVQGVGKGWAKRVYYSDNGSTAIEIALKMAFRKFLTDHGFIGKIDGVISPVKSMPSLKVLAVRGSYHGDTLGAMEAQAPSSYTGALQQPWYSGKGSFLEPPTVGLRCGKWVLDWPASFGSIEYVQGLNFQSREEIFDSTRDKTSLRDTYQEYISQHLSTEKDKENVALGALIIEPVMHGAGGMFMVDPLFQRILVQECQKLEIPVIFDEVFSGCWRLGAQMLPAIQSC